MVAVGIVNIYIHTLGRMLFLFGVQCVASAVGYYIVIVVFARGGYAFFNDVAICFLQMSKSHKCIKVKLFQVSFVFCGVRWLDMCCIIFLAIIQTTFANAIGFCSRGAW